MMRRFWSLLWLDWAIWVTVVSLLLAAILGVVVTLGLYLLKGMPPFDATVVSALAAIWSFWFKILWGAALLVALFMSMKRFFNRCFDGWKLQLLTCNLEEVIDIVLLGDVVKLWRKWLMVLIWSVAAQLLVIVIVLYLLAPQEHFWSWFNVYWLYFFLMIGAYATLPMMVSRCQRAKVVKC